MENPVLCILALITLSNYGWDIETTKAHLSNLYKRKGKYSAHGCYLYIDIQSSLDNNASLGPTISALPGP